MIDHPYALSQPPIAFWRGEPVQEESASWQPYELLFYIASTVASVAVGVAIVCVYALATQSRPSLSPEPSAAVLRGTATPVAAGEVAILQPAVQQETPAERYYREFMAQVADAEKDQP